MKCARRSLAFLATNSCCTFAMAMEKSFVGPAQRAEAHGRIVGPRPLIGLGLGGGAQCLHGQEFRATVAQPPFSFFQQAAPEAAPVVLRPNADGVDFPGAGAMLA